MFPLLASISTHIQKGGYFRYEPTWALHERFRLSVTAACGATYRSDPTARVVARLRLCRSSCKKMAKTLLPLHPKGKRLTPAH
jgi:hypothetical protein